MNLEVDLNYGDVNEEKLRKAIKQAEQVQWRCDTCGEFHAATYDSMFKEDCCMCSEGVYWPSTFYVTAEPEDLVKGNESTAEADNQ